MLLPILAISSSDAYGEIDLFLKTDQKKLAHARNLLNEYSEILESENMARGR